MGGMRGDPELAYILEHLDRAMELLGELRGYLERDVGDWMDLRILKPALLAHVSMIEGRVGRARYLAGRLRQPLAGAFQKS